jgi:hypothetical protein
MSLATEGRLIAHDTPQAGSPPRPVPADRRHCALVSMLSMLSMHNLQNQNANDVAPWHTQHRPHANAWCTLPASAERRLFRRRGTPCPASRASFNCTPPTIPSFHANCSITIPSSFLGVLACTHHTPSILLLSGRDQTNSSTCTRSSPPALTENTSVQHPHYSLTQKPYLLEYERQTSISIFGIHLM